MSAGSDNEVGLRPVAVSARKIGNVRIADLLLAFQDDEIAWVANGAREDRLQWARRSAKFWPFVVSRTARAPGSLARNGGLIYPSAEAAPWAVRGAAFPAGKDHRMPLVGTASVRRPMRVRWSTRSPAASVMPRFGG